MTTAPHPPETLAVDPGKGTHPNVLDDLLEGCLILDLEWRFQYLNHEAVRQLRTPRAALAGHTLAEVFPGIEATELFAALAEVMTGRSTRQLETRLTFPDGSQGWFDLRIEPVYAGIFVLSQETTPRHDAEVAVAETDSRFLTLYATMLQGVVFQDATGRILHANPAAERILGRTVFQMQGQTSIHPDWQAVREDGSPFPGEAHPASIALRTGQPAQGVMGVYPPGEQAIRWIDVSSVPLFRPGADTPYQVYSLFSDITEARRTEQHLRLAGRLEAVGRLAGGVAHDFNNLLSVILGNVEFVLQSVVAGDPLREDLEEIRKAGRRAAEVTQQLLAFGRKQVLTPVRLDLNAVIEANEGLIRRVLGESIELQTVLSPGLWPVLADRGPLEQVIMALAIQAREVMPTGGRLTLETTNLELGAEAAGHRPATAPGAYARLRFRDTSEGLDAETQAHLFEPFFTTRDRHSTYGIGLAVVYGIVKQSGGDIQVQSQPGGGTTYEILLPRAEDLPATTGMGSSPSLAATGTETVLVVEDDDGVRRLARRILAAAGYEVLVAANGGEALLRCEQHPGPIHLVLSDVVMPLLGGSALAERLQAIRPGLRLLFMSGFTDDAVVRRGVIEPGHPFIGKPFTAEALARKVREVLDA
jgi:signal transduction histidine kinase